MPERNIKVICSMTMCEMGCSSSVGHSAGHWVGLRGFCMASYAMVAYINDSVFMTILSVTMKIRLWLQKGFELIAQWLCWATEKAQGKNCCVTLLQREFVSRRKAMNMSFHLYPIKRLSKMATFAKKAVTLKAFHPIAQWLSQATEKAQGENCCVSLRQREFVSLRMATKLSVQ